MGHIIRGIVTLPTCKCDPIHGTCFNQLYYQLLLPGDIEVQIIILLQQFSQCNILYYSHGIAPQELPWSLVKPVLREILLREDSKHKVQNMQIMVERS